MRYGRRKASGQRLLRRAYEYVIHVHFLVLGTQGCVVFTDVTADMKIVRVFCWASLETVV